MIRRCIAGSAIIAVLVYSSPADFGREQAKKSYETGITKGDFQLETGEYAKAAKGFAMW